MFNKILSFSFIVSLSLFSALHAGSGVLPMFDDGTILVAAEMRGNRKVWCDMGGLSGASDDDKRQAAARYGNEKTAMTIPIQIQHLNGAPFVDVGQDRMFFVRLPGSKPSIQEIIETGNALKRNDPTFPLRKIDYKYVRAQDLIAAASTPRPTCLLPGTNDPLLRGFLTRLRKDSSLFGQGILRTFVRNTVNGAAPIRPFAVPPVPVNAVTPTIAVPTRAAPTIAAPTIAVPTRAAPTIAAPTIAVPRRAAPVAKPSRRATLTSNRRATRASRRKSASLSRRVRRQRHTSRLRRVRQQRRMTRKSHIQKQRRVSRRSRHISRRRRR